VLESESRLAAVACGLDVGLGFIPAGGAHCLCWRQLLSYGLYSYDPNRWMSENLDAVLPGNRARYLRSRQAQETLHEELFSSVQDWTVMAAFAITVKRDDNG
jgi:hypothetical protein